MIIRKIKEYYLGIQMMMITSNIYASSGASGVGLPWEGAVEKIKNSLMYVGGLLVIIGLIWAGYNFLITKEKEAGFQKLTATVVGGAVIFGTSGIISVLFGASF